MTFFRIVQAHGDMKEHAQPEFIEKIPALVHGRSVGRAGCVPAILVAAEDTFYPHPLCNDNLGRIDPAEIGKSRIIEYPLQLRLISHSTLLYPGHNPRLSNY
jgi:hypothetical protein